VAALPISEQSEIEHVRAANNQATLRKVAILPAIMFACYIGLIAWFRSRGGYRDVPLPAAAAAITPAQ
jgi:hypothetical protein